MLALQLSDDVPWGGEATGLQSCSCPDLQNLGLYGCDSGPWHAGIILCYQVDADGMRLRGVPCADLEGGGRSLEPRNVVTSGS